MPALESAGVGPPIDCFAKDMEQVTAAEQPGSNPPAGSGELLERDEELRALAASLDSVQRSGHGKLVLVSGEAGIGKTALVRCFCDLTRPADGPLGWV